MKKLAISLLLVGVTLYAQQTAQAQVRFGLKAGVNASNVKIQSGDSFDPLPGYQGGLMAEIILSSKFSIQPALLYATKGFSTEVEFRNQQGTLTGTARSNFKTNYLDLPVLALYKAKVGKSWQLFGGPGLYAACGINGKFRTAKSLASAFPVQKITFGPKNGRPQGAYNRMDYGLAAAAGIEMGRASLAINYGHSLTGILPEAYAFEPKKSYNRSLSLMAGYWFGKDK